MGIGIYARSGASTVELSGHKKKNQRGQKIPPEELDLRVSFNRANYVEVAIEEVYKTLLIAFALVVLIIYLFLGNLKAEVCHSLACKFNCIIFRPLHFWIINKYLCSFKFYIEYWHHYR